MEKMPLTKNMKWPKSVVTIVIISKHGLRWIIEKFGDLVNKTVGKTRIFLHFSLQKTATKYAVTHTQQTARLGEDLRCKKEIKSVRMSRKVIFVKFIVEVSKLMVTCWISAKILQYPFLWIPLIHRVNRFKYCCAQC